MLTRSDTSICPGTHAWPGRTLESLVTSISRDLRRRVPCTFVVSRDRSFAHGWAAEAVKPSTISTAQLHRLPGFHMPPIKQVFSLRSYPVDPVGNLILRRASHLDAFSAYPDRT